MLQTYAVLFRPGKGRGNMQRHNLFFIIDSAQTAGFLEMDFKKLNADAISFHRP